MKHMPSEVNSSKAFLDRFSDNRRSWVMQRFLAQVRTGRSDPREIVAQAWAEATANARLSSADERTKHLGLTLAIENHPEEAVALARHCVWWESLSPTERAQRKADSSQRYQVEWVRQQPATQKQVMFLRQLGHCGPVGNRAAASEDIARRLAGARK